MEFQFPPPRGGEHGQGKKPAGEENFNSRPREGANPEMHQLAHTMPISIPAPARGRTVMIGNAKEICAISIPAPARGRTGINLDDFKGIFYFNSRPREGANAEISPRA